MAVQYGNLPGKIPTGSPQAGRPDDFGDENFKYELMWTGGMHVPAPEQVAELERLGLIINGKTPTIRKCPIDINHNDGSGAGFYINEKNFRTLGMMENELGLEAGSVCEAWNWGRPKRKLAERYDCPECSFVCGDPDALEAHIKHVHGPKSAGRPRKEEPEPDAEEAPGVVVRRCKAKTKSGQQCTKDAVEGSDYCYLPAHAALANAVPGVTGTNVG